MSNIYLEKIASWVTEGEGKSTSKLAANLTLAEKARPHIAKMNLAAKRRLVAKVGLGAAAVGTAGLGLKYLHDKRRSNKEPEVNVRDYNSTN